jgi:Archaeal/vacuolar-type H+-ATPase subunit C
MSLSKSNNAISAKILSKLGNRLTFENYNDMINLDSVGDVALYLKNNTRFSKSLDEIKNNDIHRGRLEELISKKLFNDYTSLCSYNFSKDSFFYEYVITLKEIENILYCVRVMGLPHDDEFLFGFPNYFNNHTTLDLYEMAKVNTFNELIEVLNHTPYYKILKPFYTYNNLSPDYTAVETALTKHYYRNIFKVIRKSLPKNEQKALIDFLGFKIDLTNVLKILRIKKSFNASVDYINSCIIRHHFILSESYLNKMIEAPDYDTSYNLFKNSKYKNYFLNNNIVSLENFTNRILYKKASYYLRFSVYPSVIFACYVYISGIELENIFNVIEGVRYNYPFDDIMQWLIF